MALDSVIVTRGGVPFTVNAANLSELSMILQICSRAPQLPVLCELSLRLFLLLLDSHTLLEEQGYLSSPQPRCAGGWGSSVAERLHPGEITTHCHPCCSQGSRSFPGLGNVPRVTKAAEGTHCGALS